MTDRNRADERFDEALISSLADGSLPPEEAVRAANPSRRAVRCVLIGLSLCGITLKIGWLPYLLPAAGHLLSLLGLRALSRENGWFGTAYGCAWGRAVYFWSWLILLNLPGGAETAETGLWKALSVVYGILLLIEVFALGRGLSAVRRASGLDASVPAALGLFVWHAVVFALAVIAPNFTGGTLLLVLFLGSYVMLLRALFSAAAEFEEAEYAIRTAPVRVSDRSLAAAMLIVLAAGLTVTGILCARLPMNWQPLTARSPEAEDAVRELEDLGVPQTVLDDLTEDDLLACRGAERAVVKVSEEESPDGGVIRFTNIGLRMPEDDLEGISCRVILCFEWIETPRVCGTDCIHLWEPGGRGEGYRRGEVGGRLLVDRDGTTYSADYAFLGRQMLSGGAVHSFFFTSSPEEAAEIVGEFSPDRQGRRMRGYVSYALTVPEGRNVSEWYNYTHQISPFLYPRTTALSHQRPSSAWVGDCTFRSFYSALQFTP